MKTPHEPLSLVHAVVAIGLAASAPLLAEPASAQPPTAIAGIAGQRPEPPVVPIHTSAPIGDSPYGIWAAGRDYKVSFDDGATFVPMLGRGYQQNRSLSWRTVSATIGGVELVTRSPQLSHGDLRAEYDLGAIVEAYDVRSDGVEQTFVVAHAAAAGELTIRGRITTSLRADAMPARHAALAFVDEQGRELITYGAATAIDADGNRFAMTTSYRDGEVTLRLPGSWLAQARFPIVVDPMLGSGGWVSDVDAIGDLDVVRPSQGSGEQIWVAYTRWASASDSDVFLQRFDDDGVPGALAYWSITPLASAEHPSCAYVAAANKVVTIYENFGSSLGSTRRLYVHLHDRNDPNGNTDDTWLPTPINAWKADVGGTELNGDGNRACIVWQQESQLTTFQESSTSRVYGCLFDVDAGTITTPQLIASALFTDCHDPCVSTVSSSGSDNRWAVAWQSYYSLPTLPTWDVEGRLFYATDVLSPTADLIASSSGHEMAPQIAGSGDRWLVACTGRSIGLLPVQPTTANGTQLRVVRVDWPAQAAQPTLPFPVETVQTLTTSSILLGGLDYHRQTDSHWAMAWHDANSATIHLQTVGYRGQPLHAEPVGSTPAGGTVAASGVTYNSTNGQFVAAYGVNYNNINYVQTNRFEFPAVAAATSAGASCSPASIWWQGHQYVGSEFGAVRVSGAAPDSLHLLAISAHAISAPVGGIGPFASGCWSHIDFTAANFIAWFPIRLGASPTYELKLPETLASATFYFQDLHTIGNGDLDLVTTQRLVLPIVR